MVTGIDRHHIVENCADIFAHSSEFVLPLHMCQHRHIVGHLPWQRCAQQASKSSVGAALFTGVGGITEAMNADNADDTLLAAPYASLWCNTGLRKEDKE